MLPSGRYWIGDLCYVIDDVEWFDFVSKITKFKEGEFKSSNGRKFAVYDTEYGDGSYLGIDGTRFDVDSGQIGCIDVRDITDKNGVKDGLFRAFSRPFRTRSKHGIIYFGDYEINTRDETVEQDEPEEF